jgi:hypothetical protein
MKPQTSPASHEWQKSLDRYQQLHLLTADGHGLLLDRKKRGLLEVSIWLQSMTIIRIGGFIDFHLLE